MSTTPTFAGASRRRRATEFHLPSGKKIIVALPDEAAYLQSKYRAAAAAAAAANSSSSTAANGEDDACPTDAEMQVEVVLHGSDEHRRYLGETLSHAEAAREALRRRHGDDFDEWVRLQQRLDAAAEQLDRLADHSGSLNASFSKFGYDAQLRTFGDNDSSPPTGGAATPMAPASDAASGKTTATATSEWEERGTGQTIKLFKRPVIKQYFHRGLLWRSSEETQIMSFELFLDLLYVGIIHINGEHLADDANGHELLRFIVTFGMSWKIWSDIGQIMSWFETNDVFQRVQILFQLACLLGFTTNMTQSFYKEDEHNTYTQLVSFYLAARLFGAAQLLLTGALLPLIKGVMAWQAAIIVVPSALWIASIHVEDEGRIALIFVALALDLFGSITVVGAFRYARFHNTPLAQKLRDRTFEFYPAMNIEHKVERTNALVSLVIGYSVVGVMFQNYAYGINSFLGKAVLGLVQAFMFNWLYFEVDNFNLHVHAIRRAANTAIIWQYAHLIFVLSYIVASAGLSKLVVLSDLPTTDPHDLTHHYEDRSEDHIPAGIRYFYCHGLALALLSMGVIALTHDHKSPPNCRMTKHVRLVNRAAVSVVLFLLPLAKSLSSLELVGVTVGLVFWVLLVEVVGMSCPDDPFVGSKEGCCVKYSARCRKKDLEFATRGADEEAGGAGGKADGKVEVVTLDRNEKVGAEIQG